jgi:hypothetical protein|tara:strand:- start:1179 stop:1412 length:234 start_codon:yes stop_codon:yes gene_type:complete
MSNYTVTTNFGSKDSLPSGSANKVIKGSEFSTEFNNLVTAVNSKADLASPALTGSATAVNLSVSGTFSAVTIDGGTY